MGGEHIGGTKLPSVAMHKNAGGVLVSDIAVGSLVIGEETTVADLARALEVALAVAPVKEEMILTTMGMIKP